MKIGYARVSTDEQRLDLQIKALQRAGCDKIITDHGISGSTFDRQGLTDVLASLREGDIFVVWRLDRLGRSLVKLVEFMNELGKRGVEFQSLCENIDTSSSGGRLMFHMMAALAEFERSLISERTRAGMQAAKERGKHIGRPHRLNPKQRLEIRKAVLENGEPVKNVANKYKVSDRSIQRILVSAVASPSF
ncbi:recombinase family protein [Brucellaceae bacterium D45D]